MEGFLLLLIVNLSCLGSSLANSIGFSRPCKDLSPECLKNSIQAALPFLGRGAPELGLEPLDPYNMEQLNLTLAGGIEIHLSKGYAKGLKKCIVDYAKMVGNTIETQMRCNLTMRGKYKSSGQLLMFSIDGDGDSSIKCHNLRFHSIVKLGKRIAPDGREYLKIVNANINHSFDGRVSYGMTNLIKGNPEISKVIVDFMNNNWRMIAEEFGKPVVDFGVTSIMRNVKRLFDVVSIQELNEL